MTPKSHDHMPTTSLWRVAAKWPTQASKTKLILCPRDHKDTAVSVWQDFERVPVFHGVCEIALTEVLATQMGVMWRSKKVSLFELHKFNPLLPHCGLIAQELVHCYTWGCLQIVSLRQHSRPALLTFLSTTRIHSLLKNLTWQPH